MFINYDIDLELFNVHIYFGNVSQLESLEFRFISA